MTYRAYDVIEQMELEQMTIEQMAIEQMSQGLWVGVGTRLQVRKLPANSELETVISNKLETLRSDISHWQYLIDYEPITYEGISTDHNVLKGNINSLYQEALYARVTDKLSYDIISLMGLIDRIKKVTHRFIRNAIPITGIIRVNDIAASDVRQSLSVPGATSCDNNPLMIAGKCSGFDTDLVTQTSGVVIATLQMQGGGGLMYLILMMHLSLLLMIFLQEFNLPSSGHP